MPQPLMRRAQVADSEDIGRLVAEAYAHYPARIGARPAPMDADQAREIVEKEVWVCPPEGEIQGVLVLRQEPTELWVDNLAVGPKAAGSGVARALLDHATVRGKARGARELRLLTHELMTENRALYDHLGWEQIETPPYERMSRVYFRKRIESP